VVLHGALGVEGIMPARIQTASLSKHEVTPKTVKEWQATFLANVRLAFNVEKAINNYIIWIIKYTLANFSFFSVLKN